MDELSADVRLKAAQEGGAVCWRLAVGGNAELARELGIFSGERATEVTVTVLTKVAALGAEGRTSHLSTAQLAAALSNCGKAADVAPPSVLPDISPQGGRLAFTMAFANLQTSTIGETKAAVQSPPLRGRCPAGQRAAT